MASAKHLAVVEQTWSLRAAWWYHRHHPAVDVGHLKEGVPLGKEALFS